MVQLDSESYSSGQTDLQKLLAFVANTSIKQSSLTLIAGTE